MLPTFPLIVEGSRSLKGGGFTRTIQRIVMPLFVFRHNAHQHIGEIQGYDAIGNSIRLEEESARKALILPEFMLLRKPVLQIAGEPPMEDDSGSRGKRAYHDDVKIGINGWSQHDGKGYKCEKDADKGRPKI